MNSPRTRLLSLSACLSLLFLSACSTIVRHPQVEGVKKVAIISLYTNQEIEKLGGGGSNSGGAAFLGKLVKGDSKEEGMDKKELNNRERLAQYALERFSAELSRVPGWKVVSTDTVIKSAQYKKLGAPKSGNRTLAAIEGFATRVHQARHNTPPGMWAIPLKEGEHNAQLMEGLKVLAKDLKVDAVAVVDVDLAYDSSFSIGGTGTAKAAVASSTKVLNRDTEYAVAFPEAKQAKRFESDRSTAMISGQIFMTGDTEMAFQEAINKSAWYTAETIIEGLAKK